jgi:hypothetical protein
MKYPWESRSMTTSKFFFILVLLDEVREFSNFRIWRCRFDSVRPHHVFAIFWNHGKRVYFMENTNL